MIKTDIKIDWDWVEKSLLEKERIRRSKTNTIFDTALKSIERAKGLVLPKAMFVKKAVLSSGEGSTRLEGGTELYGKMLSSYMKRARDIYLFLATIGSHVEDEASALMKSGDTLAGYLIDRVGAFAVESLADELAVFLGEDSKLSGDSVSMPFSPGYCDWPVEEQAKLDRILNFAQIGVHLTESYMMSPKKSISGLIGIAPEGLFSKSRQKCEVCTMKSCSYRNI